MQGPSQIIWAQCIHSRAPRSRWTLRSEPLGETGHVGLDTQIKQRGFALAQECRNVQFHEATKYAHWPLALLQTLHALWKGTTTCDRTHLDLHLPLIIHFYWASSRRHALPPRASDLVCHRCVLTLRQMTCDVDASSENTQKRLFLSAQKAVSPEGSCCRDNGANFLTEFHLHCHS